MSYPKNLAPTCMRKSEEKIICLLKYARGTVFMKQCFPHFPLQKKKKRRNSHPKWDHITTGRMRKMSNSFGPSLLHRWKAEQRKKMFIFQMTTLATQIQTVPISEYSKYFIIMQDVFQSCYPTKESYLQLCFDDIYYGKFSLI